MSTRTLTWLVFTVCLGALLLRINTATMSGEMRKLVLEQQTYQELRELISDRYVGDENRDELRKRLFFGSIQGLSNVLDRHTAFATPEQYELGKSNTSGHFAGIGVEITFDDQKGLVIVTPLADTPAFEARLWPADRVIKIDDFPVDKLTPMEASQKIRGEPDTIVHLTVEREGVASPLEFHVKRAIIKVQSVQEAMLLQPPLSAAARIPADAPKIGYIQLVGFQQDTPKDVAHAVAALEKAGMQGLLLDLRQNPGGLLDAAVALCEQFLPEGIVVTTRERGAKNGERGEHVYHSKPKQNHVRIPMVVLINGRSASASEIVAGCLHDHARAKLVGDKSFGKGSVQSIIPFQLGEYGVGALTLTTARYYMPNGECIDGKGIEPDYKIVFTSDQLRGMLYERHVRRLARNDPRPSNGKSTVPQATLPVEKTGPAEEKTKLGDPPQVDEDATPPRKPAQPFVDVQIEKAVEVLTQELRGK